MQNLIFKWQLISELRQAKVLMVFVYHLLSVENKWALIYYFFGATLFNNLFDNLALFKNMTKIFVIGVVVHNLRRHY